MRLNYLDTIAGLLIVRMIIGHLFQCCQLTDTEVYWWMNTVFSFFMPWFFFKSGMLFTHSSLLKYYNSGSYLKGRAKKILVPYIIFSIISMVVYSIILLMKGSMSGTSFISPLKFVVLYGSVGSNLPMWFMLTLFLVYVSNYYFVKHNVDLKIATGICVTLAAILNFVEFKYPATINSTLIGLSFYLLGYQLKNVQYDKKFVAVFTVIGIMPMLILPSVMDVCTNTKLYGNWFIWYLYSLSAIVIINNVFKSIKSYFFPLLSYIGRNAITFLITHWMIQSVTQEILASFRITSGYEMFCIMFVTMIITLPLLNYVLNRDKLKFLIGK